MGALNAGKKIETRACKGIKQLMASITNNTTKKTGNLRRSTSTHHKETSKVTKSTKIEQTGEITTTKPKASIMRKLTRPKVSTKKPKDTVKTRKRTMSMSGGKADPELMNVRLRAAGFY